MPNKENIIRQINGYCKYQCQFLSCLENEWIILHCLGKYEPEKYEIE
jgi:hypothetical protein